MEISKMIEQILKEAKEMQPMIEYLSSSQINLYMQCSLKYRFQYIESFQDHLAQPWLLKRHLALAWFLGTVKRQQDIPGKLCRIFVRLVHSKARHGNPLQGRRGRDEFDGRQRVAGLTSRIRSRSKDIEMPFTVPLKDPANGKLLV
jgi:putative RecB family exonuclease